MSIDDLEEHLKKIKTSENNLNETIEEVLAKAHLLTNKINVVQTEFNFKKIEDEAERKKAEDEEFDLLWKNQLAADLEAKAAADLKAKAAAAKVKVTDCSDIKYQNSALLKVDKGGSGECFFLCLQEIFRINSITKSVETIREEVSNSLKQYIIQNLETLEGKNIVTQMFISLFYSPDQDQKNKELTVECINKTIEKKIILNNLPELPEDTINSINFYVNNLDTDSVASCYIAPITQTFKKNRYECYMDENYLYNVGNYVKSVIKDSSGIIILNCVQSPTILIFPKHNEEFEYVNGFIETVKTFTEESIMNRFLIIRVNGNHYVLGATIKDNKYNYYFNLHQENWQGLISTDFIDNEDFIDEEDLANHIAQSIAREEEAARQAQKVANKKIQQ